jgi:hypothetical protein
MGHLDQRQDSDKQTYRFLHVAHSFFGVESSEENLFENIAARLEVSEPAGGIATRSVLLLLKN